MNLGSGKPFWRRANTWGAFLIAVFLAVAAVTGYQGWRLRKFATYAAHCRQLMAAGNWAELGQLANRWVEEQPGNAEPWIFAAEAAQKQGDLKKAADYLRQLPPDDPKTVPAMMELASVLFGTLNDPLEAERVCQRVLEIQPRMAEAHRRLIFYYAVTMQREKLLEQIEACFETDCDTPETYVYRVLIGSDWNAFSNAHELLGVWLQAHPEDEYFQVAYALHVVKSTGVEDTLGTEALPAGEQDSATVRELGRKVDELIAQFPQNAELLVFQLRQASSDGNQAKVAELLSRAPAEAAEDNRFWRYKGWLHAARSESDEAEQAYLQAIQLNPYDWVTRHQFADLLRQNERITEAVFLAELATQGKELRREILELPDVRSASPPLLVKIEQYAIACGDKKLADRLRSRLIQMGMNVADSTPQSE